MRALTWINFILGLWLIFAGFNMSRGVAPVMAQQITLGIIIAVLSIAAVRRPEVRNIETPEKRNDYCFNR